MLYVVQVPDYDTDGGQGFHQGEGETDRRPLFCAMIGPQQRTISTQTASWTCGLSDHGDFVGATVAHSILFLVEVMQTNFLLSFRGVIANNERSHLLNTASLTEYEGTFSARSCVHLDRDLERKKRSEGNVIMLKV